ncbi:hypothetical protein EV359DRAFT_19553, partial [Lentinula novae-zelandiae]
PWAQPAARLALDQYHNLVHAKEEIIRLNREIQLLTTSIHEETAYIQLKAKEHQQSDPLLAIQIQKFGWELGCCNDLHLMRLKKLGKMPGFSGTLLPGQ